MALWPACHFAAALLASVLVQVVVEDGERVASSSTRRVKRSRLALARDTQVSIEQAEEPAVITPVTGLLGGLSVRVSP